MQRVPDPDAIGAAAGLAWLLGQTHDAICEFLYRGTVSHPQTRAMLNVLGITCKQVDSLEQDDYDIYMIVDSTPDGVCFPNIKYQYVVDHHKVEYPDDVEVRNKSVGSCASLVYELILEAEQDLIDPIAATALYLGLYTDTDGLRGPGTTGLDFEAFQYLATKADHSKLKRIFDFPIPTHQFDLEARAIAAREVSDSKLVTCLGEVPAGHRDVMPVVADSLMRMSGVDTVVVFAFIGQHVDASVRSSDSTLDVDAFCKETFGQEFHGTAGSKQGGIGGGRAPLGIAVTDEDEAQDRAEALAGFEARLKKRIIRKLGR